MARPPYRMVDHTADMAFEVEAADFAGLLAAATAALGDVILADGAGPWPERRRVAVRGADREDVVVAWLGEVLWLFEREGFLARGAEVRTAARDGAEGDLLGVRLDPVATPPDRVVKAVTYHDLAVLEGSDGRPWRATVVLDL